MYHYCSVETLKKILENKTIRLTDITKMNDPKEIEYLFDNYKKWLQDKVEKESFRNNKIDISTFYKKLSINFFEETQLGNSIYLAMCFSENKDDLHMWNCYADKGVNLEINKDYIEKLIEKLFKIDSKEKIFKNEKYALGDSGIKFKMIEYKNEEQCVNLFNREQYETKDFTDIFKKSITIKSDFYKEEKECRLICELQKNVSKKISELIVLNDVGYYTKTCKIVSTSNKNFQHVYALDIDIDYDLIKSIKIGPNSTLTKEDIEEMLYIYGWPAYLNINKSEINYR